MSCFAAADRAQGGAQHNLRLLRKGINRITREPFRDGLHPEPGMGGRAAGGNMIGDWGSGGIGVHLGGESGAQAVKGRVAKGPLARARMEALLRRIKAKEARSCGGAGVAARQA